LAHKHTSCDERAKQPRCLFEQNPWSSAGVFWFQDVPIQLGEEVPAAPERAGPKAALLSASGALYKASFLLKDMKANGRASFLCANNMKNAKIINTKSLMVEVAKRQWLVSSGGQCDRRTS